MILFITSNMSPWAKLVNFAGKKCLKPVTIPYLHPVAYDTTTHAVSANSIECGEYLPANHLPTQRELLATVRK